MAAFDEMIEVGMRAVTLDRVAQRAGVSKGVLLHHFKDKDALYETVVRRANNVLKYAVIELQQHADTPLERLYAMIVANFAEPVFNQQICSAWIGLCADAPFNENNLRIQNISERRLYSNLKSAMKALAEPEQLDMFVKQLASLINGLWLQASTKASRISTEEAVEQVSLLLMLFWPDQAERHNQCAAAKQKMLTAAKFILNSNAFKERI